ncbi:hypothetical protein [Helicobacter equorum]|uniref:hypothetical protein n=1 Tax=Helicobacter equorum TaxID=361872 RepID=UPI00131512F7|nr:hypothetical protein [Helicobacter equorum]
MKKIWCCVCVMCGVLWSDNFIIDSYSLKDFELLLKPNQTLIINHQTKALLGILETLDDGTMKRLPIPKKWLSKHEEHASRLKIYSDYTETKTTIGSSTTTIYQKNQDFESKDVSNNPALQSSYAVPKNLPTPQQSQSTRQQNPSSVKPQATNNKIQNTREWDKKKIIYEQKTEVIDLGH